MIMALNPLLFVLGPLVYFYINALTSANWRFGRGHAVHFIPAAAFYIYFFPVYRLDEQEKIRLITDALLNHQYIIPHVFYIAAAAQILVYLVFSVRRLLEHDKFIKNNFSFVEHVNLLWLKRMLTIYIVLWVVFSIRVFYPVRLIWELSAFLSLLTMYMIGYFGYNQPVIFHASANEALPASDKEEKKKYASSSLTEKESTEYLKKTRH